MYNYHCMVLLPCAGYYLFKTLQSQHHTLLASYLVHLKELVLQCPGAVWDNLIHVTTVSHGFVTLVLRHYCSSLSLMGHSITIYWKKQKNIDKILLTENDTRKLCMKF